MIITIDLRPARTELSTVILSRRQSQAHNKKRLAGYSMLNATAVCSLYDVYAFAETSRWSTSGRFSLCKDPAVVILHECEMTARLFSALFQIQTLQTWECLHLCPVGTLS